MNPSIRKDKSTILTIIGMITMILLTGIKVATSSHIAGAALIIAGLAFFFLAEAVAKTPDSESGLSFKRFFVDLKKPGVILLILIMLVLTPMDLLLSKLLLGSAYVDHVMGRVNVPDLGHLPMLALNQIFTVLGEEIGFRAFFVGKGTKLFSFWPVAVVSAVIFSAAHFAAGDALIVA